MALRIIVLVRPYGQLVFVRHSRMLKPGYRGHVGRYLKAPLRVYGAQERTRTFTSLRTLAPEASASTNFTTWAGGSPKDTRYGGGNQTVLAAERVPGLVMGMLFSQSGTSSLA